MPNVLRGEPLGRSYTAVPRPIGNDTSYLRRGHPQPSGEGQENPRPRSGFSGSPKIPVELLAERVSPQMAREPGEEEVRKPLHVWASSTSTGDMRIIAAWHFWHSATTMCFTRIELPSSSYSSRSVWSIGSPQRKQRFTDHLSGAGGRTGHRDRTGCRAPDISG
jgi:hypothetical protein